MKQLSKSDINAIKDGIFDGLASLPVESQMIINRFGQHQLLALEIMVARQGKYGPHNISRMGHSGVLVRMNDKLGRLGNGLASLGDESVEDTHYDIANYGLIALMVHEGSWPKAPVLTAGQEASDLKMQIEIAQKRLKELGL